MASIRGENLMQTLTMAISNNWYIKCLDCDSGYYTTEYPIELSKAVAVIEDAWGETIEISGSLYGGWPSQVFKCNNCGTEDAFMIKDLR